MVTEKQTETIITILKVPSDYNSGVNKVLRKLEGEERRHKFVDIQEALYKLTSEQANAIIDMTVMLENEENIMDGTYCKLAQDSIIRKLIEYDILKSDLTLIKPKVREFLFIRDLEKLSNSGFESKED